MTTQQDFGKQILQIELENCKVPARLRARKARLLAIAHSLRPGAKYDGLDLLASIFELSKLDGWDFVKGGPEGRLDRSRLKDVIDTCLAGKLQPHVDRAPRSITPADQLRDQIADWFQAVQGQLPEEK